MLTDEGKKIFGEFLKQCGYRRGLTSDEAISKFITQETGIRIPESQINSLVSAHWKDKFKFDYLVALVASGLLQFEPEIEAGRLLEYNDVMEIFRGHLNPFTGERYTNGAIK